MEQVPLPAIYPHLEPLPDGLKRPYEADGNLRWFLLNHETMRQVLQYLGHEQVRGREIVGYTYVNTASGDYIAHNQAMEFSEPMSVAVLLERADLGMDTEFPNDFKIRLIFGADETSRVMVDYEGDEQPSVCIDCEPEHTDEMHSCDHEEDIFSSQYAVDYGPMDDEAVSSALAFI